MINLLPPQQKQRLAQEEIQRMILIWGFIIAVFFTSFTMTILLTYIRVNSQVNAETLLLTALKEQLEDPSAAKLKEELISTNRLLSRIEPVLLQNGQVNGIFDLIAGYLPPGLYITRLSYKDGSIILDGFSPTRQDLLTFKQNLEREELFSKVDFPPNNWIKPEDINFIVNLSL